MEVSGDGGEGPLILDSDGKWAQYKFQKKKSCKERIKICKARKQQQQLENTRKLLIAYLLGKFHIQITHHSSHKLT